MDDLNLHLRIFLQPKLRVYFVAFHLRVKLIEFVLSHHLYRLLLLIIDLFIGADWLDLLIFKYVLDSFSFGGRNVRWAELVLVESFHAFNLLFFLYFNQLLWVNLEALLLVLFQIGVFVVIVVLFQYLLINIFGIHCQSGFFGFIDWNIWGIPRQGRLFLLLDLLLLLLLFRIFEVRILHRFHNLDQVYVLDLLQLLVFEFYLRFSFVCLGNLFYFIFKSYLKLLCFSGRLPDI